MEAPEEDSPMTKKQLRDAVPKRIKALSFGILSPQDIVKQGVVEVSDRALYDLHGSDGSYRPVTRHGPLDLRMGTSNVNLSCETCDRPLQNCNGHFGFVRLALPAFHIGFLKKIIEILHCICKECSRIMLPEKLRRTYLQTMMKPNLDSTERKSVTKKILIECKKCKICDHCGAVNGTVKKVAGHAVKLVHDKYLWYNRSTTKSKKPLPSKILYERTFKEATKTQPHLETAVKRVPEDIHPLRALTLFRKITNSDSQLLGMNPQHVRPEMLIWTHIPAPPVAIRPSVTQDSASTEDDITNKLGDIVQVSNQIRNGIKKGEAINSIVEKWDYLQIQVAMYINSEVPNLQQPGFGKPIRSFVTRLKGKQGRFRGNLSGKRVDFTSRTVISPDPNLGVDEVAVPEKVAAGLTYPERVSVYNMEKLRARILNGVKYPGVDHIIKKGGRQVYLKPLTAKARVFRREREASGLQIGDIVYRHLEDGDIVLFNRQPSLHKLSIMAHKVVVRKSRTFRLNECVCTPYNADFDGDEMNLHIPQTEEARTEAAELMGVKHNLATPKDGTPIIAATQDFITAAYLLSSKDRFYDRQTFSQICSHMLDADAALEQIEGSSKWARSRIDLPPPTVLKPEALWTGKQVFNLLMKPSRDSSVLVNFDAPGKEFMKADSTPPDLSENEAWICIRNSEIMCGRLDKAILGSGKKDSIFYVMMRDFGPGCAVHAMNRLAKLSARWLSNEGFSIGIDDVYPDTELTRNKQSLVNNAYTRSDDIITQFKDGKLRRDAGCDQEMTMENKISGVLNEVRQKAGALCFEHLSHWNSPIIMAKSGAKGSNLNVSQMVATVGQQIISNARVADGFQDRTLPHFPKAARQPTSKGFVQSSFFSGLSPTELIFHAMSGREGLVDTAVKTAETGYMSRRLMKSLEDLSVQYDTTVRNSTNSIVQFQFGEDSLDPVDMEGRAKPVNFDRTFLHAQSSTWSNSEDGLLPHQINDELQKLLRPRKAKYARNSILGVPLEYDDRKDGSIDQLESRRDFIRTLEYFISGKAERLAKLREHLGMDPAREEGDGMDWTVVDNVRQRSLAQGAKISMRALHRFIELCFEKYFKAEVQPAHAVGAVGAQSIGEPGTQMTLKTFHFAGVAGMSITQGVPRIKEIINGSKKISTPLITCELDNPSQDEAARAVKSRIEKTFLRDIIKSIEESWTPRLSYLRIQVDMNTINELQLDIIMPEIRDAILRVRSLKLDRDNVRIRADNSITIFIERPPSPKKPPPTRGKKSSKQEPKPRHDTETFLRLQSLKRAIPDVAIKGYPEASRAVITKTGKKDAEGRELNRLLVEGYGFKECMNTSGVLGDKCTTNSIVDVYRVLGIEAARKSIINELEAVMGAQMDIDPRHMQLLADTMTFKGDILGITRFGMTKMRDSVLQLASFEKTADHLFEAAVQGKSDGVEGVSECIIMGQPMRIGTGAMKVIAQNRAAVGDAMGKVPLFEAHCDRKAPKTF